MRPSLNRRLVARLAAGVLAVWLAAAGWMGWRALHEIDEIFDQMLVRTAAAVLATVPAEPASLRGARLPERLIDSDRQAHRPTIVLRDAGGRVLVDSDAFPAMAPDPARPLRTVDYHGRRWRVLERADADGRYTIQVAAPLDERDEMLRRIAAPALFALLGLLLLLPPIVYAGLRGGLSPLRQLSRRLDVADALQVPILTDARVPLELAPFTEAVDRLVERLRHALERERRFTADAAHELRHPLAALRLELDLAARADADPRGHHLDRAQAALERMQRLVGQLLLLARVEQASELDDAGPLDLAELAGDALREASERAAVRQLELSLDSEGDTRLRASAGLLGIALANLLDNALRHAPVRGRIAVRVSGTAAGVRLVVDDSGSGFADPSRLGERFHRPAGSLGEGSGLGLSIVQAITTLHHGHLAFDRAPLGGARVTLDLPRAHAAAPARR
ncbi:sensor histidine kinase N-terminal domain-containing protein [Frateuria sp. MAH-13]|uniref:histidine kinase n=1 Tax=Frateuria flava TaxID=2821489 RepID=A0ABS4DJJ5_9GAMM|nr:ATP-binding protein [Frateuria flava]MBP1473212.1 sensor histidine kinase N-terminal domain-containing protein [Frateuria flava]